MEAIKFNLSGKLAHFKNPENNYYIEFTYGNIHKPALLGLLGAMIGLRGRKQAKNLGYIEYYKKLKGLEISIVPKKINFDRFIDESVNGTGFANDGFSQIIRREFLENPEWDIYLIQGSVETELWIKIKESLLTGITKYPINLGGKKNSAFIKNVVTFNDIKNIEDSQIECKCNSLIKTDNILKFEKKILIEYLPTTLNELTLYRKERFAVSDEDLCLKTDNIYFVDNKYLYFLPDVSQ